MTTIRRLSRAEVFQIGKFLEANITRVGDCGDYTDDWMDDAAVDEALGIPGVTSRHVGRVRRDLFGNFSRSPQRISRELEARLEHLEQRLTFLAAALQYTAPSEL